MTLNKSYVPYTPTRIMYQLAVFFVGLFIMALLWYALYSCILPLSTGIATTMEQYENMTSYPSFGLANTFLLRLWTFLLAIVGFGLLYWSWIYSSRKGAGVNE